MTPAPSALFESFAAEGWGGSWILDDLLELVTVHCLEDVVPALARIEQAVAEGLWGAGYVAYEAAPAFDSALPGKNSLRPLLRFGLFRRGEPVRPGVIPPSDKVALTPEAEPSDIWYRSAFDRVKGYIASGDVYQVNLTFRRCFTLTGDPFDLYRRMTVAQPAPFSACLNLGDEMLLSASPELFFRRIGDEIAMAPMKGTAPRDHDPQHDDLLRTRLAESPKERAENLMIVDLVRNDLGRIAIPGTVTVPELFQVESYPTVHQMVSPVTAQVRNGTSLVDILAALFPCGSVTGAPKRRSMEIIRELEPDLRGVYCGAIGLLRPGETVFSVAIRTARVLPLSGRGEMGIGSGLTWDADPDGEWEECRAKGRFLFEEPPDFCLVETMLLEQGMYSFKDQHLERLHVSAAQLGFACNRNDAQRLLDEIPRLEGRWKVRLLLRRDGVMTTEMLPLPRVKGRGEFRAVLSCGRIDSSQPLLRHKTTYRPWYEGTREQHGNCLDVIFCNERGEVTEGTMHNLVVRRGDRLLTPPVDSGLLPGVLRGELLRQGTISEAVITADDLKHADGVWLINSVRGWRRVTIMEEGQLQCAGKP